MNSGRTPTSPWVWIGVGCCGLPVGAFLIILVFSAILAVGTGSSSRIEQPEQSLPTASTTPSYSPGTVPTPAIPPEPARAAPQRQILPDLQVVNATTKSDEYTRYVTGTVRNNTEHTYSYVQISINLYDGSRNQVGSTMANVNNLEPGSTWNFKAIVLEDSATSFKVKEVTGF